MTYKYFVDSKLLQIVLMLFTFAESILILKNLNDKFYSDKTPNLYLFIKIKKMNYYPNVKFSPQLIMD